MKERYKWLASFGIAIGKIVGALTYIALCIYLAPWSFIIIASMVFCLLIWQIKNLFS